MTVPVLRDRLALLDATFQESPDFVTLMTSDGALLDANRSALAFAQSTLADAMGAAVWDAVGWQQHPALARWLRNAVQHADADEAQEFTLDYLSAPETRSVIRFRLRVFPIRVSDQVAMSLVGADITAHVISSERANAQNSADRKATQSALRESETQFRAAIDAGQDLFVIARTVRNPDGVIVDFVVTEANARAVAMSVAGRTREDLIGRPLLDVSEPSRHTGLWEQCCRVVATGEPFLTVQSVPLPDAPARWVQRQIVKMGDSVAISSRDVTASRREHEALEASEARHRQLFESSGAIQLIVDAVSGVIIDANPAAEEFYGWTRATMLSMRIGDLDEQAATGASPNALADALVFAQRVTRRHLIATGNRRDVEVAGSPVVIDGRDARHMIVHDVSDRIRAEQQLRESEARFRAVVTGMSEGVVVHDASGAIRVFNPSAERILRLSGAQLLGLQPVDREWQAVHEDGSLWPVTDHPAMIALRNGKSQPRALMGVRRGDDEFTWLHVTADPIIRPGESRPYAAVAVFFDVTEHRNAEERLRQAQKLEAVGQLAGGIAHDFNNLLTVIRGATGFVLDSVGESSPHASDLHAIERASERAEALTRQLLAIGRRQLLRAEAVDLSALVKEQLPILRGLLPRTVFVNNRLDEAPVIARLDRRHVIDALRALVDNARLAMPLGGTLTIATTTRRMERPPLGPDADAPRSFAVMEVIDTGEGMSNEIRMRVFEPFFSTQPFGANRGMGLASVHGIMTQLNGFVECDSSPGKGTAIRLYFPEASADEVKGATPTGVRALPTRGVLMVDDDALLRDLGRRMLERLGNSVAVAASGSEALAMLERSIENVSVLVSDLTMPGMSGMELLTATRARYPTLPLVAISGFSMDPEIRHALDQLRIPFLGKPFTSEQLARAIDTALKAPR